MSILPVFSGIKQKIMSEIEKANLSVMAAVAWITDNDLLNVLAEKAREGVIVNLILSDSEINEQNMPAIERVREAGANIAFCQRSERGENYLMHNKFCVIDYKKVITGSFNWTYQAAKNDENIVVIEDKDTAGQFIENFMLLREGSSGLLNIPGEDICVVFYADCYHFEKGQKANIFWNVINADIVSVSVVGNAAAYGNTVVEVNSDTIITLTAINRFVSRSADIYLRIIHEPKVNLESKHAFIPFGAETRLAWSCEYADSIFMDNGFGEIGTRGTLSIKPAVSTTYRITARNKYGEKSMAVVVGVIQPPRINSVNVPLPVKLKMETEFAFSNYKIPVTVSLGKANFFNVFRIPQIRYLALNISKNTDSVTDLVQRTYSSSKMKQIFQKFFNKIKSI